MGIISTIKFLESVIRHSKVSLDNTFQEFSIVVSYDYAEFSQDLMNEFDTDFATAMLELGGEIVNVLDSSMAVKIPNFSGLIVGSVMVGGFSWKASQK